jgi:hypothetical protein
MPSSIGETCRPRRSDRLRAASSPAAASASCLQRAIARDASVRARSTSISSARPSSTGSAPRADANSDTALADS